MDTTTTTNELALRVNTTVAEELGARYPNVSRTEEHRLLEACSAIEAATGTPSADTWRRVTGQV